MIAGDAALMGGVGTGLYLRNKKNVEELKSLGIDPKEQGGLINPITGFLDPKKIQEYQRLHGKRPRGGVPPVMYNSSPKTKTPFNDGDLR